MSNQDTDQDEIVFLKEVKSTNRRSVRVGGQRNKSRRSPTPERTHEYGSMPITRITNSTGLKLRKIIAMVQTEEYGIGLVVRWEGEDDTDLIPLADMKEHFIADVFDFMSGKLRWKRGKPTKQINLATASVGRVD